MPISGGHHYETPKKDHVFHMGLFHNSIQLHPQRALAHNDHFDPRSFFLENLGGPDQILVPLMVCQMSHNPDQKIFWAEVQLPAKILTGPGLLERSIIDAIRYDFDKGRIDPPVNEYFFYPPGYSDNHIDVLGVFHLGKEIFLDGEIHIP
jgi:hypothetical protein